MLCNSGAHTSADQGDPAGGLQTQLFWHLRKFSNECELHISTRSPQVKVCNVVSNVHWVLGMLLPLDNASILSFEPRPVR
jgi:hypothetical protein